MLVKESKMAAESGFAEKKRLDAEETTSKRDTTKKALEDFATNTTLHGLQYIATSSHFLIKLCWLGISIAFTVIFIIQAMTIINDFRTYPYSTKIDLISRPSLNFPAVTVCNANRMRRSQLVNTRFEGLIDIDGGASGGDYDYSWWFSSGFLNAFSSSQWQSGQGSSSDMNSTSNSTSSSTSSPTSSSSAASPSSDTSSSSGGGNRKRRGLHPGVKVSLRDLVRADRAIDPMRPIAPEGDPEWHSQPQRSRHNRDINRGNNRGTSRGQPAKLSRHARSVGSLPSSSSLPNSVPSSVPFNYLDTFSWFNQNQDSDFAYYNDGWDTVTSEDDWQGFYQNSNADDYSDLIDVVNPTQDQLAEYGHQLEDFILQCTFDRRQCNISTDFLVWQNRYFGNCFTFNSAFSNVTRETGKTGALDGLHLTLFVEQPEYLGILSPQIGAKLSIHDPDHKPFPEEDAIDLPPGRATAIGVRQEFIERLGGKYGNCTHDGANTNFTSSSDFSYSATWCKKTCYQLHLHDYCGCVDDTLFDNVTIKCSVLNDTQQWCRQYISQQYLEDRLPCTCPTPCTETKYSQSISSMVWPSERYEQHLQSRIENVNSNAHRILQNNDLSKKNLIRVKIFYEELNYEYIEEVPVYTIPSLLGNVGGLMGLYIGMSFVSVFEICALILRLCKILFKRMCCNNDVQPVVK